MQPIRTVLIALACALPVHGAWAGKAASPSPLGMHPAQVEYVSNDAPFVVFDIAPRSWAGGAAERQPARAALTFVATDDLAHVTVMVSARSARLGMRESAQRVACGAMLAGYYRCDIPLREALSYLEGGAGLLGLRIVAEGMDGERSMVRITLPVGGGVGKPAARARPASPRTPKVPHANIRAHAAQL